MLVKEANEFISEYEKELEARPQREALEQEPTKDIKEGEGDDEDADWKSKTVKYKRARMVAAALEWMWHCKVVRKERNWRLMHSDLFSKIKIYVY